MYENDKKIITLAQAASMLCVSKQTLRNWDKQDILKSVRFGVRRDRRYIVSDIEKFLKRVKEYK
jgi:DNA-binding transcriptional MerR regulator